MNPRTIDENAALTSGHRRLPRLLATLTGTLAVATTLLLLLLQSTQAAERPAAPEQFPQPSLGAIAHHGAADTPRGDEAQPMRRLSVRPCDQDHKPSRDATTRGFNGFELTPAPESEVRAEPLCHLCPAGVGRR